MIHASDSLVTEWDTEPNATPGVDRPPLGEVLRGRYRLQDVLGETPSSCVIKAWDEALALPVAIKLVRTSGGAHRNGLLAEARASLRLTHPNIVRVYTWDCAGDWDYLVMELVDGEDLHHARARLEGNRLPVPRALDHAIATLDALAYAHGLGVLHHDVKPGNLLVSREGVLKLCDFGLASVDRGARGGGTPTYMSPERLRGQPADARSDVYAVGATLYTLLTGDWPFAGDPDPASRVDVDAGTTRLEGLDPELVAAVRRAMCATPTSRYPTARAFHDELVRLRLAFRPDTLPPGGRTLRRLVPPWAVARRAPPVEVPPVHLDLVEQPAGTARIGGVDVRVPPCRITRTPVSNAAWQAWLADSHEAPPAHWPGRRPPEGREGHPVVGIALPQARRYAAWAGGRLPTEGELACALRSGTNPGVWEWCDAGVVLAPATDGAEAPRVWLDVSSGSPYVGFRVAADAALPLLLSDADESDD